MSIDQIVSDFDGVTFHISTPESKTKILISLQIRCFKELVKYGAQAVLEREYGQYVVEPEDGYDFSIQIDLENLPADQGKNFRFISRGTMLMIWCTYRGPQCPDYERRPVEAQCYGCTIRAGL